MRWIERRLQNWQRVLEEKIQHLNHEVSHTQEEGYRLPVLTQEEKLVITRKVRGYVEQHFTSKEFNPLQLGDKENDPVNLDVAFWVAGELRASAILADNLPLGEALRQCTERALHDGRFRPLTTSELGELRIELTFFGPWDRLTKEKQREGNIDPERGYVACTEGKPRAWYLPMVHNTVAFVTLRDFLESLVFQKGKLSKSEADRVIIYTFPTVGWIESVDRKRVLNLSGPLVAMKEQSVNRDMLLEQALAWLLKQEITPGVFVTRRIPSMIENRAIDWARLGFTALILGETGQYLGRTDLREVAERTVNFLEQELSRTQFVISEVKCLAALYAGLTALELGDVNKAKGWLDHSQRYTPLMKLHPIGRLHGAKLLARLDELEQAATLFEATFRAWEGERERVQLALYPELLPVALILHQKTGESRYLQLAESVGDWYVKHQNADGSFPFALGSARAAYVRGTGKILEVLACLPERYQSVLERGLQYVRSLQYTEDNMFHIPREQRTQFLGGFRHDVCNREAWIDAAGHMILTLARLNAAQKKTNLD